MLKEVACAGRVDTPRERKCNWRVADLNNWARCHRQSQQKRSKSNSWEHFAFELLATMLSVRALYPCLSTSNHMNSPAILSGRTPSYTDDHVTICYHMFSNHVFGGQILKTSFWSDWVRQRSLSQTRTRTIRVHNELRQHEDFSTHAQRHLEYQLALGMIANIMGDRRERTDSSTNGDMSMFNPMLPTCLSLTPDQYKLDENFQLLTDESHA